MTSLLDLGLGRSTNNNEIHLAKQLPCLRDGNEPDDVRQSSRTENSYPKLLPLDQGKNVQLQAWSHFWKKLEEIKEKKGEM